MQKALKQIVLIEPQAPGVHFFRFSRLPRLGLPLIGAILRRLGYYVRIFCEDIAPIDWKLVFKADLIGISTITATATRAYELIKKIKRTRQDLPVIIGGPHVTFLPEEALAMGADYVVRGEGEETIVELINHLEGRESISKILGLSYLDGGEMRHNQDRPLLSDLDSLPSPDLTLIAGFEKINVLPIQTSRGCPYNCKFCSVVKMFGRGYRTRSTGSVLEELARLRRQRPKSHLFFYDDNFSANTKRTKALLEGMLRHGIAPRPWSAQERVEVVKDPELLQLMQESGCSHLCLGLESVNPQTLKDFRKGCRVEDIEKVVESLHQHRIGVHGMFVFGGDGDRVATIKETLEFSLKRGIDTVQYSILTPLPGTETYRELEEQDRIFIKGVMGWSLYDGHHVVYQPQLMSPWQLQTAVIEALARFYSSWRGLGSALTGRLRRSFFAFYGHRLIKKWKLQNKNFLAWLKGIAPDRGQTKKEAEKR